MDSKYIDNGAIIAIGTLIILAVLAVQMTGIQNHRDILKEYPNYDLILLTNDTVDRLELLGRSYSEHEEFYRWSFRNGELKTYIASDLIDTSYWQLFKGTKGIYYNEKSPLEYAYDSNRAYIVIGIDYFLDSRHTNYVGRLEREIEIYPNKNKETLKFYPKDKNETKYNLQWVHETDHYRVAQNLKGEHKVDLDKLQINWNDSIDKVSAARQYLNGKVKIRYKSAYGDQVIDPQIIIGQYVINYDFTSEMGGLKSTPECFPGEVCHLLIKFTLNKKAVIGSSQMTKIFKNKENELIDILNSGINIYSTYEEEIQVWISDIVCENNTLGNGTIIETCIDNGYYMPEIVQRDKWEPITFPLKIEADIEYYLDVYGIKSDFEAIEVIFEIIGIELR